MEWENEAANNKKFESEATVGPAMAATEKATQNTDAGMFLDNINFKNQSKARLLLRRVHPLISDANIG